MRHFISSIFYVTCIGHALATSKVGIEDDGHAHSSDTLAAVGHREPPNACPMEAGSSTWSPSAKKPPRRIGGDASTWTPKPSKENDTAACPSQQDAVTDLGCLTELQNLLKHELELQVEDVSKSGPSSVKRAASRNDMAAACHHTNALLIEPATPTTSTTSSVSEKCTKASHRPDVQARKLPSSHGHHASCASCSKSPAPLEETTLPQGDKGPHKKTAQSSDALEPAVSPPRFGTGCNKTRHFAHECSLAAQQKALKMKAAKYTDKLTPPDTESYDDDVLEQCDPSGFPGKHFYHGRWIWSLDKDRWQWESGKWTVGRDKKCQFVRGKWEFIPEDGPTLVSHAAPKDSST